MSLETALYNLLSSDSDIEGLVGENIFPVLADEQAKEPYIVFQVLSVDTTHTLTGSIGMIEASVQVSCWTNSYYDSIQLSGAVRSCLDNYSDRDNPSLAEADIEIQCIQIQDEGDLIDFSAGVDKSKHYGKRLTFNIFYNRF